MTLTKNKTEAATGNGEKKKPSKKKNAPFISVSIIISALGFFLSIILITWNVGQVNSPFIELQFSNKNAVVREFLEAREKKLNALSDRLQIEIAALLKKRTKKDSALAKPKQDSLKLVTQSLHISEREISNLSSGNPDTALTYYRQYFSINRNELRNVIDSFSPSCLVPVTLTDTSGLLSPLAEKYSKTLEVNQFRDKRIIPFIQKNPLLGYWLFFSFLQWTLWFMLITILFGMALTVKQRSKVDLKITAALPSLIIPFIFIGLFVAVFYWYLIDTYVISDAIFIEHFNDRMMIYSVPGYLAAVICFGMYLYAASKLNELDGSWKTQEDKTQTENDYKKLRSLFDTAFLSSAIILSAFVLWAGIMFNAINSEEVMRFYQLMSDTPYLNYDFVYLIGLFHTAILLIFYIPVRVKFNSLQVVQQNKETPAEGSKKIWGFLQESLATILVTASPLITGLLQNLISTFLKQ